MADGSVWTSPKETVQDTLSPYSGHTQAVVHCPHQLHPRSTPRITVPFKPEAARTPTHGLPWLKPHCAESQRLRPHPYHVLGSLAAYFLSQYLPGEEFYHFTPHFSDGATGLERVNHLPRILCIAYGNGGPEDQICWTWSQEMNLGEPAGQWKPSWMEISNGTDHLSKASQGWTKPPTISLQKKWICNS